MTDKIRMDSHKLIYHPERVSEYMKGKLIYPIEVEVGLSGACNHRCIFCAVDYMGYQPAMLDSDIWIKNIKIMKKKGLKSVIYAGEGEPLLNQEASRIMKEGKSVGVDCALSTNGVLLTKEFSEETLRNITWVRFSIAAGKAKSYQAIHQCEEGDFEKVLLNMQNAVDVKKKQKLKTELGAQLLLLPENKEDVVIMAKLFKEIGIDYFTIKPFSQHPDSKAKIKVDYDEMLEIEKELNGFNDENYKVYFRKAAMENLKHGKSYDKCRGLNFMTYIDARGDVYPCIAFMGNKELKYGNILDNKFNEIWESSKAKDLREEFQGEFLKNKCRQACRLDEINKYLTELKTPNNHVNFI